MAKRSDRTTRKRAGLYAIALMTLAAGLAACGGSESTPSSSPPASTETTAAASTTEEGNTGAADTGAGGEAAGASLQPGTLQTGMTAALSGFLPFDDQISNGIKLAVDEINAGGGIGGKVKVTLDIQDTKSETANVVKLTQQFIDAGAQVVFAECNADAQVAAAAVAQQANILEISGCDAAPNIGSQYPNYWGIGLSPNVTMAALAQYAADQGYKTIYMLNSSDLLYNKTLQQYFKDAAEHLGLTIVGEDNYTVGATDYAANITKIKSLNPQPDAIFSAIFVPDSGTFVKQLRAAGVETPFLSGDGSDSPLLLDIGGPAAEGTCVATHAFPVAGEPTAEFYEKYKDAYGKTPDSAFAGVGYNEMKVLEAAVLKAGSIDPTAIAEALASGLTVAPPNALWEIEFPAGQHWPQYNVPIICVQDGKFERAAYSYPEYVPSVE